MSRLSSNNQFQALVSESEIQRKVKELGEQISKDYQGTEIIAICVLKGSFIFTADLLRQISVPNQIEFLAVSSYGASTESSGVIRILKDLEISVENKHVLFIEDIIDTGLTMSHLIKVFETRKPASIKICTLLDNPDRREVELSADYVGFSIPDEFVVGYGLDYAEGFRNLPGVYKLPKEYYSK